MMPITDVLQEEVLGVRIAPSPFQRWLGRRLGYRPKSIYHDFRKPENRTGQL